jgi:tetratricopeptide (TPR) repeat protein
LNPGYAWAHHWYAHSLEAQGRIEEALAEMRAALALDPISIAINWDVGNELVALHRYEEAEHHLKPAAELFPNNPVIGFIRAEAFYDRGDIAAGHRVIEGMKRANPDLSHETFYLAWLGYAAAFEGRRGVLSTSNRLERSSYRAR